MQFNTIFIDKDKDEFIKDSQKVIDSFWITMLGFISLQKLDPDFVPLNVYMVKGTPASMNALNKSDEFVDYIVILKILHQMDLIKRNTYLKLVRYFVRMKMTHYDFIDEDYLRKIINEIRIADVKPSPQIYGDVMRFKKGEVELEELIEKFYSFNLKKRYSYSFTRYANMLRRRVTKASEIDNE